MQRSFVSCQHVLSVRAAAAMICATETFRCVPHEVPHYRVADALPLARRRELVNHAALAGHPHVVALREVFLTREHLAIVMDFADSGDLSQLLSMHVADQVPRTLRRSVLHVPFVEPRDSWRYYRLSHGVESHTL